MRSVHYCCSFEQCDVVIRALVAPSRFPLSLYAPASTELSKSIRVRFARSVNVLGGEVIYCIFYGRKWIVSASDPVLLFSLTLHHASVAWQR